MRVIPLAGVVALLWGGPALSATEPDLLAMPLEELAQLEVSVATGTPRTVHDAPAATSVITAQELDTIGAQHMDDALKAVPGLHVSHGAITYESRYYFRGIFANNNPHTLVLVNGLPMTSLFVGDRLPGWQGVPVADIARIEVVRGPGSAVYGADAFGGVINIITKSALDEGPDEARVAYGSFDTRHASLLQRATSGDLHALWAVDYRQTEGDRRIVAADWATGFDQLFGTHSSQAPGPLNDGSRTLDARTELVLGDWRLRASWQQVWDLGTAQGLFDALDPYGRLEDRFGNLDLAWNDATLVPGWALEGGVNAAYKELATTRPLYILPPGSFCFPGSPSCFPDGMQDSLSTQEAQAGARFTLVSTQWEAHRLRLGAGFDWGDLYRTTDRKNFDASGPGLPVPLGRTVDFSDTPLVFQPEAQRTNRYVMAQDEWQMAPDWELTAGVRHDRYSDFGGTTNPRLALVWQTTSTLTTKLLYQDAFRAPSFAELYVTNIGVNGNPDLKPERLRNEELAFSWQPTDALTWDLNVFRYRIRDFIQAAPDASAGGIIRQQNVGRLEGKGGETELRYQLPVPVQLLASFSTAHMRNEDTGQDRGQVPRQTALLRAIWDMADRWQMTAQVMHVGRFEREVDSVPPDPRPDMKGYDTVDMTVRTRLPHGMELTFIAANLFGADVREPSNGPAPPQTNARIPGDLPQPGRSLTLQGKVDW